MFEHVVNHLFKLNLDSCLGSFNSDMNLSSVFGVFVTIKRHTKLKQWPEGVHGCIGYIDPNRNKLSSTLIFQKVLSVSYSAMYSDDRNKYFGPILIDPYSEIEITYMKLPLYEIDLKNGMILKTKERFNNEKYGLLLLDTKTKNQTTYLPGVFSSQTNWNEISSSLLDKGNVNRNGNVKMMCYDTLKISRRIIDIIFSPKISIILFDVFTRNMMDYIRNNNYVPYSIDKSGIHVKKNEFIRNVSSLLDIKKYSDNKDYENEIDNIIQKYFYSVLNNLDAQELSFILPYLLKYNTQKQDWCSKLSNYYRKGNIDREFSFSEVVLNLSKYCSSYIDKKTIKEYNNTVPIKSIFQWNWDVQVINNNPDIPRNNTKYLNYLKKFIKDSKVTTEHISKIETNELAVLFEGLCSYGTNKDILIDSIKCYVFIELLKNRWNPKDGCFYFLNREARIDITCHVLNGLYALMEIKKLT